MERSSCVFFEAHAAERLSNMSVAVVQQPGHAAPGRGPTTRPTLTLDPESAVAAACDAWMQLLQAQEVCCSAGAWMQTTGGVACPWGSGVKGVKQPTSAVGSVTYLRPAACLLRRAQQAMGIQQLCACCVLLPQVGQDRRRRSGAGSSLAAAGGEAGSKPAMTRAVPTTGWGMLSCAAAVSLAE